ncbi:MAG: hypothetical protein Alpg2KO_26240 [Alphaproteobacteria bacterium]
MRRYFVDKVGSVTRNVGIGKEVRLTDQIVAEEGYVLAGRILNSKRSYNTLEDPSGRMMALQEGDRVAVVLGHRNALHGYSGIVPDSIKPGDVIHMLNIGGVAGHCTSANPSVGPPFEIEVAGAVLTFPEFESRTGIPAHIRMNALSPRTAYADASPVPLVLIAGTCMNSGKTIAAAQLVRHLASAGLKVGAAKLTGVSLMRDTLEMMDYGARWALSFTDAGITTTSPQAAVGTAHTVLAGLAEKGADVIVAELGDGIMGQYGVQEILSDPVIQDRLTCLVFCANDPVGAWGGVEALRQDYGLDISVLTGPATDNEAGSSFIRDTLGVTAKNAFADSAGYGAAVLDKLGIAK